MRNRKKEPKKELVYTVWLSHVPCAEILFEIEHLNLLYSMQKSIEDFLSIKREVGLSSTYFSGSSFEHFRKWSIFHFAEILE